MLHQRAVNVTANEWKCIGCKAAREVLQTAKGHTHGREDSLALGLFGRGQTPPKRPRWPWLRATFAVSGVVVAAAGLCCL